ncbi:recombination protein RecR [Candidatus Uhrbacteria bacterium CG_4_10_14_0_2_um_filter_41_7]|uniref:Recombination protein RecR n=1 Tax=Candidatus Uhrbacteria bacterium CG_4_9_14_3_um_filter_41_35 TaxID=1975034 RepID=A0A2M7XDS1_9BACT|nr:MAG: recombination protein RecR [Candidatus Uhrbacteria bacterium CG11_big_fil_rev_8_21_14_0_20_41_9]PIZ53794.1 MAG: recombination protein RecR [Candidatus Uhrbacteria bacterium CG_4_10_14_0_2_um_filter_41_7]PJA45995.1 MAG: recombination protein RecR [Candidatus Uhrbacteria bacterium CG_4_9_14_3_um_filter_41_35]
MRRFPAPIHSVVSALSRLPGVGPKTALRYTFALLLLSPHELDSIGRAISNLRNIQVCNTCLAYAEKPRCELCSDSKRLDNVLCVIAESRDIATLEATNAYHGKYFVLGGRLNPIDGATPETLNVDPLITRLEAHPEIEEVILAFSPDVHGETTMIYLARKINSLGRKVTKLARGLPIGADIEYTDEVTLGDALIGRREV